MYCIKNVKIQCSNDIFTKRERLSVVNKNLFKETEKITQYSFLAAKTESQQTDVQMNILTER